MSFNDPMFVCLLGKCSYFYVKEIFIEPIRTLEIDRGQKHMVTGCLHTYVYTGVYFPSCTVRERVNCDDLAVNLIPLPTYRTI